MMKNNIIKMDQALFGYFNGHRMLANSNQLSSSSQKILEPLSDLSGTNMKAEFSEYITGYPLIEDGCYSLSKTWYADEMDRPGCVWTHTFFIKFEDLKYLSQTKSIFELFLRPSVLNDFDTDVYAEPLYLEVDSNEKSIFINEDLNIKVRYLLKLILDSNNPIFFSADESKEFNFPVYFLWSKLASTYLGDFSFCTGSLSNRMVNKKSLNLQIVPSNILKNISRTVKDAYVVSNYQTEENPLWLDIVMKDFIFEENTFFTDFLLVFGKQYAYRGYVKPFAVLLSMIMDTNETKYVKNIFEGISKLFLQNDSNSIKNFIFILLLSPKSELNKIIHLDTITALKDLSTDSQNEYIDIEDWSILYVLESLWEENDMILKNVFNLLICHKLNKMGERVLSLIGQLISPVDLPKVAGDDLCGSNVLVLSNNELALCRELWLKSINFQIEILDSLVQCNDNKLIFEIVIGILNTSRENISEAVYRVFGDRAIEIYLEWVQHVEDQDDIIRWSKLCDFNISICISHLGSIENKYVVQCIIEKLDPYSYNVLTIDQKIWIKIFREFYQSESNLKLKESFACFLLPLIIQSKRKYPYDIAYFAFYEVHKKLKNSDMNYFEWGKLSNLLPPVFWYNSWDKCKRLRKIAKKLKYEFDFNHIL